MGNSSDNDGSNNTQEEIWVNEFTEKSARVFREQMLNATKEVDKPIIINIDSYGGYVDSLASMIETISEIKLTHKIITVCRGKAISCGAILLSLGDIRYCGEMSRTMVHNVSSASWGDAYEIKSNSNETMRLNKKFMGLLADHCGITYEELQSKIKSTISGKEIWMDAKGAKDMNLVDQIGLPILSNETSYAVHTLTTQKADANKKLNTADKNQQTKTRRRTAANIKKKKKKTTRTKK